MNFHGKLSAFCRKIVIKNFFYHRKTTTTTFSGPKFFVNYFFSQVFPLKDLFSLISQWWKIENNKRGEKADVEIVDVCRVNNLGGIQSFWLSKVVSLKIKHWSFQLKNMKKRIKKRTFIMLTWVELNGMGNKLTPDHSTPPILDIHEYYNFLGFSVEHLDMLRREHDV